MIKGARLLTVCIILLVISTSAAFAQTSSEPAKPQENLPAKPQEDTSAGYPVTLNGQTVFFIKGEVPGYGAKERAKVVSKRVKEVAEDPSIPTDSVTTSDSKVPVTLIMAKDRLLVAVFNEDAKAEGKSRQQLAAAYIRELQSAIERYRTEHSAKRVLTSSVYFLVVTILFVALIYLLNRLYRTNDAKIKAWADSKKVSIHIQSLQLVRAERIKATLIGVSTVIRFVVFIMLLYTYIHLSLSFFPQTKAFSDQLLSYLLVPLSAIGRGILAQIPNLVILAIIVVVTYYALKITRLFFKGIENGTISFTGFYPEWGQPTYRIVRVLIIAFAAVIAFPYIPGSESPAFKGVSIFLGVLFSLGSSSAIANVLAGYTLTYRRIFKAGDRVKIADFTGDVIDVRLQVVHLRTVKNEEIVVPSSVIVNSHVINYSSLARTQGLILHTTVTIGYDTPWRQVEALLLMAAERTLGILREPAPFVLQTSLGDFYAAYELNVYTDDPLTMAQTYTDLHRNIQDAFNEYGVQIMSPNYRFDPERPKIVPKDQWYAAPAKPPGEEEKN